MSFKEVICVILGTCGAIIAGVIIGLVYVLLLQIALSVVFFNVTFNESAVVLWLIVTYIAINRCLHE